MHFVSRILKAGLTVGGLFGNFAKKALTYTEMSRYYEK